MTDTDPNDFETNLIADMRAHGGEVTTGPLAGHPLLVMTSRGAKSGEERRAILTYSRDGDAYVVAGTAGGSPTTPGWVQNVREHPEVDIEVDTRTVAATASEVTGDERDRLWERHVRRLPHFAEYPKTANRVIPIVRIRPDAAA